MTEQEWLTCGDPEPLIEVLDRSSLVTVRKCRLLSCAACYRLGHLLVHPQSLQAVQAAERWADDESTEQELWRAWLDAGPAQLFDSPRRTDSPEYTAAMAAMNTSFPKPGGRSEVGPIWSALSVLEDVIEAIGRADAEPSSSDWTQHSVTIAEARELTAIVRDIFGNPFRPVSFDPVWRTSTAVALADGMYASRDFGAMPILADALQDAGCDNAEVLNHCRDASLTHVRGCWVVDLVLGKA